MFPAFAKAAWLGIVPEFNPFKYNSFPVNGGAAIIVGRARTATTDRAAMQRDRRLVELPPILTFQSVVDFTVSTRAIINALYANLPANGSELVLFDLNRNAKFGPLLRSSTDTILNRLLPPPPRTFKTTIITNVEPNSNEVVERVTAAGATTEQTRTLGLVYPPEVFSLSHLALPFPLSDSLYGMKPDATDEDFGVQSRRHRHTRRARHTDRQHRFAESHVVQPVLSILDGTHRGRHRRAQRKSRHQRGRYCAGYRSRQIVLQFAEASLTSSKLSYRMVPIACALSAALAMPGHRSVPTKVSGHSTTRPPQNSGPSMDSRQASIGWMGCACPRFALGEVPVRSFPVTASC